MMSRRTNARELLTRYDAFLIDAFGVLVRGDGAVAGALSFIDALNASGTPYLVVTNDASRHPRRLSKWYASLGMQIAPEQVLTSGGLLAEHYRRHGLVGASTIVLGPQDSLDFVREAGGNPTHSGDDGASVIVVCDEAGYPFLETIEATASALLRRIEAGKETHLVLPNPDLVYPKSAGEIGLTSGSVALLIESAVAARHPGLQLSFHRLGKPFEPIFEAGKMLLGDLDLLMIGDQLATDILGAKRAGIDSALVTTGVSTRCDAASAVQPTWLLESLSI